MSTMQTLQQPLAQQDPQLDFKQLLLEKLRFPDDLYDAAAPLQNSSDPLTLPVIVAPGNDCYFVIDGCKRLARMRQDGAKVCTCGILSSLPDTTSCALLRIKLNRYRTITRPEQYLFIKWMRTNAAPAAYKEACELLAPDRNELAAIEKLTECTAPVVEAVLAGTIELQFAADIDRLDEADRDALLNLFGKFAFSRQMQKELVDWLPECAFREKCTVAAICTSDWVQEIIANSRLNAPQKIDKLRNMLFDRRFPTLAKAKKVWTQRAAVINPDPSSVTFKSSDAFEKNRLEIKITISSPGQAQSIFDKLHDIEPSTWDQLIYPAQLYGET